MDLTTPLIIAFLVLSVTTVGLTTLFKRIIKIKYKKFYKSKTYEIVKLCSPIIFCILVAIFTPEFIFNLIGITGINFTSKVWLGVFSGLSSGFGFQIFKSVLKNLAKSSNSDVSEDA